MRALQVNLKLSAAQEDITSFSFLSFKSKLTLYHHPRQIPKQQPALSLNQ